jgi:hypothetical protein
MARMAFVALMIALPIAAADAAVTTYNCSTSGISYRLVLDDEAGTLISIMAGKETVYGVRGIKREMGTLTVNGYVSGRGTDYVLTHRFSPSITYTYGNGGKRTDSCSVE